MSALEAAPSLAELLSWNASLTAHTAYDL